MRIARFLAMVGIASRRKCEDIIMRGEVKVNGKTILDPAINVDEEQDKICYQDNLVTVAKPIYILLNKPVGYTCSAADQFATKLLYQLLPAKLGRLFTIGRLDRDSEGLIICTNDGKFAQKVSHPKFQISKEYTVWCKGTISKEQLKKIQAGIYHEQQFLKAKKIQIINTEKQNVCLHFVLTEGKKREVRRFCQAVGLQVIRLQRKKIGIIEIGELKQGDWRKLTSREIKSLLVTSNK